MTAVYHKILVVDAPDPNNPAKDVNRVLKQPRHSGIDCLMLYHTKGLNQLTVEFVCSDANPAHPKTEKDLNNLAMQLKVIKELSEHRNEPTKHTNHLLQISNKKSDSDDTDETEEIERA